MATHSFSIDIAIKYGINEAILLQHIYFWHQRNRANKRHFYDGNYWSYNTAEAFTEIFPYFSQRQIQYCLEKLKKEELIQTANYNVNKFDRTLWYSLTEKGLSCFEATISQDYKMDKTNLLNGGNENVKLYTDINTDINTDDKKAIASAGLSFQKKEEVVSEEVKKPNKEDFKDMWREIIGDVNLDQHIPSYNKCVDCWEKMKEENKQKKYKNDLNQYFEKWIYAEREEMKKKGNIPLKSSTGQKEAQNEPIVYEEPKPVEIHIKNEFKEVYAKIERAVDVCFSINNYISRAIASIDGEELIIYIQPTWVPLERYEEGARALIKEILNKYNITVLDTKFVYKNAIRVIND